MRRMPPSEMKRSGIGLEPCEGRLSPRSGIELGPSEGIMSPQSGIGLEPCEEQIMKGLVFPTWIKKKW